MTSIGTGYDLANAVFSPDGRNFQVEYASKAVENGGTVVGIRCKEGIVLAVENVISSKLLKPGVNRRIGTADKHIGMVSSGLLPDARHFLSRARDEANNWRDLYKYPIPTSTMANRLGFYAQTYTLYSSVRPFGITTIVGGWDDEQQTTIDGEVGHGPLSGPGGKIEPAAGSKNKKGGPFLYMIEPSGMYWGYYGAATGKGRQSAKSELEKLDLSDEPSGLTLEQAVMEAARIIYVAHEDSKDKEIELEMSWISSKTGPTKGRHLHVPAKLRKEAEEHAKQTVAVMDA